MYLGIDLGTSEVKALVVDENGAIVASHSAPLTIQRPQPHWSEQAPQAWWEATDYLMATLREKCGQHWSAIKAIGLSGQMHGAVLLDDGGEVIRPAILWNDTRSAQECVELEEIAPELHQVAGNLAMPGFTAPKLLWVRRHVQHLRQLTQRLVRRQRLVAAGERIGVDMQPAPDAAPGAEAVNRIPQRDAPTVLLGFGAQRALILKLRKDLGDHLAVNVLPVRVFREIHTACP